MSLCFFAHLFRVQHLSAWLKNSFLWNTTFRLKPNESRRSKVSGHVRPPGFARQWQLKSQRDVSAYFGGLHKSTNPMFLQISNQLKCLSPIKKRIGFQYSQTVLWSHPTVTVLHAKTGFGRGGWMDGFEMDGSTHLTTPAPKKLEVY